MLLQSWNKKTREKAVGGILAFTPIGLVANAATGGGDKMDKDQKLSAEEYNHKNNVTFSSDTKTAPSGPFLYGVFECRVLRHSRPPDGAGERQLSCLKCSFSRGLY